MYLKTLFNPQRNGFVCLSWVVNWWVEKVGNFLFGILLGNLRSDEVNDSGRKGGGPSSEINKPGGSAKVRPEQEVASPTVDPGPCEGGIGRALPRAHQLLGTSAGRLEVLLKHAGKRSVSKRILCPEKLRL